MSDGNGSAVSLVVESQPDLPSFLDDKIDLKKLARDIAKGTSKAVEVLISLLESDKTDEKIKLQAASKLIEFQIQISKEISADQMQRLIAEIKLVRQPKQRLIDAPDGGDGKPLRPVVDFHTIREV